MELDSHQADDKQPGAAVQHFFQQLWPEHPRIHDSRAAGHVPADREAEPPVEGHVPDSTEGKGDTGALRQGPAADNAGDHADLQGERRESDRVSRPAGHTVPHLDRAVPSHSPDAAGRAGQAHRPVRPPLLLAATGARGYSVEQHVPVVGPGPAGPNAGAARACRSVHVSGSEDDVHTFGGPQAGVHQSYDVVDDAIDVRVLHDAVSKRIGYLLGSVQCRRRCNSGFCYRLGAGHVHILDF